MAIAEEPQASRRTRRLFALSVGFILLWNSGFIGAEFGVPYSGPLTMVFWRYLALTLILWSVLLARRQVRWMPLRQVVRVAVVGVLSHGVWLSCALIAIDRGVPAGIVALVVALQPLLTGTLSGFVTGEITTGRQWVGLVLGFFGVVIAVAARLAGSTPARPIFYLFPFFSAIAITAANLIHRRAELTREGERLSLGLELAVQATATTAALALPAFMLESLETQWVSPYILSLVWLVLGVSLGAYALMWRLLAYTSATRVASLFFLGPPVTMFMAWAAFGDSIRRTDFAGLLIAGCGILLVAFGSRRRTP